MTVKLPIAAPSANRFGHVSPTSSEHVLDDLGEENICILKDDIERTGGCSVGIESTVCKVSPDGKEIHILRCGAITSSQMVDALLKQGIISCNVIVDNERALNQQNKLHSTPNGNMHSHYNADSVIGTLTYTQDRTICDLLNYSLNNRHRVCSCPRTNDQTLRP